MPRRAPETLADYLVVAISPLLIMLLVGSLVFFLIEVFYQGQYEARLLFVMAMFVMAIVCVARISMEEGSGYAALFGLPLAIVVGIALARFVEIQGPLAAVGPLINWGLMALVWWSAHKLTWDCTLVDETQDASGQGLLQTMGMDESSEGSGDSAAAGTSTTLSTRQDAVASNDTKPWWETWLEPDRRPHAPGVWVVYFSLAALPLFGIGGWFVPAADASLRSRVFWLMALYVASALALLVATSFLGLRRYLRQRQLEMPLDMTATWVALGGVLIAGMLVVAAILPRPSGEYSLSQLPIRFASAVHEASRFAVGREGTEDPNPDPNDATTEPEEGQKASSEQAGSKSSPDGKGDGVSKPGESSGKGGNQSQASSGGKQSDSTNSGKSESQETKGDSTSKAQGQQPEGKQGGEKGQSQSDGKIAAKGEDAAKKSEAGNSEGGNAEAGKAQSDSRSNSQGAKSDEASSESSKERQSGERGKAKATSDARTPAERQPAETPRSSASRLPDVTRLIPQSLGTLLRSIFYAVLVIVGLFLAWRYRAELAAAWHKLLDELRQLFAGWFGKSAAGKEESLVTTIAAPRPFSAFNDPFLTGEAGRMSWPQLVRYTFQAVEAWGRERRCPRDIDQTPQEFAQSLGAAQPHIAPHVRALAASYGQLAYARGAAQAPPPLESLRALWHALQQSPAEGIGAVR